MGRQRYSVAPGTGGEWQVKRGAREAVFSGARREALRLGRKLARESGGELVIHGADGGVESRRSFGRDEGTAQSGDVGAYDAKTRFSELLERVEAGEEVTITRHGSPVARLVPIKQTATRDQRRAVIERILGRRADRSLGGLKVKDLLAEGRR